MHSAEAAPLKPEAPAKENPGLPSLALQASMNRLSLGTPVFDALRRFDPRDAERPGQYVPTQSMGTR